MRYQFIQTHQAEFDLEVMVRMLKVSRSGFYDWHRVTHVWHRVTHVWHRVTHVGRDEGHKALEKTLIKSF
jgi:hypothetical protein